MRKVIRYAYVQPHIVGTPSDWCYCFDTDWETYEDFQDAVTHGMAELEHDDFWIMEVRHPFGSPLDLSVSALFNLDGKKRGSRKELLAVREELDTNV